MPRSFSYGMLMGLSSVLAGALSCKTSHRSKADQRRFQRVWSVWWLRSGVRRHGHRFSGQRRVPRSRMKLMGYPRSDRFFSAKWQQGALNRINRLAPGLTKHRVILYAPTYRDSMTFELTPELKDALVADPNAVVVIKLHPLLQKYEQRFSQSTTHQVRFYPQPSTMHLLMVTETLITDYSSIAFDYSLLPHAHSLLFYMSDLEEYQQNPAFNPTF